MDLDEPKPFIWRKKYEELGIEIDEKKLEAEARLRIEENKVELEKIRERQKKRDLEHQQRLNDADLIQRQKESEHHEHWVQQEDDFILKQHKLRSKIRIRDGRAKPIDMLAHYIDKFGEKTDVNQGHGYIQEEIKDSRNTRVEFLNPCDWFNGLSLEDLESLKNDLIMYKKADKDKNQEYWLDLIDITKFEQLSIKMMADDTDAKILKDVLEVFEQETIDGLNDMELKLEDQISDFAKTGKPSIDENFCRNNLLNLRACRARKRLTENHKKNLQHIKSISTTDRSTNPTSSDRKDDVNAGEEAFIIAAKEGMNDKEEAIFKGETAVSKPRGYKWANQYQPRKPSYLNRVHTGFEWNKYNRTHYDIDNPPPKAVQGYKFNIYYPDLINKSDTPEFFVIPCEDDKDFAVIRFSAGAPYEDIAFKIVNKDWNKSPKSGYRCQFKRGVLQLWFMFKRYKYRR